MDNRLTPQQNDAHMEETLKSLPLAPMPRSITVDVLARIQKDVRPALITWNDFALSLVTALCIGAVFFGANTYIGNGPNFMVKSIADHAKVHTPSFLEYVWKFTLPFMLPMLIAVWLVFFRH